MPMEQLNSFKVICEGGLNSNQNYLELSDRAPGSATLLQNFEPSLFGGYRRLTGYAPLEADFAVVDPVGSEGRILGIHIFGNNIIAQRKTTSASTYKHFAWTSGGAWVPYVTGLTHTVTNIKRVRSASFNFDGTDKIAFADGINSIAVFDGTTWVAVTGDQSIVAPELITVFKNHVFSAKGRLIAHSAPLDETEWDVAGGAGQLNAGFRIKQIKPFRDELFIFGETQIKKVVVDGTTFVIKDVTSNVGCLAPESVVEINGDLQFLSQDGFRSVAATMRIEDVELSVLSKNIQQDVTALTLNADFDAITSVVIRRKSQVRTFFSDENLETSANNGVIGGLRAGPNGAYWEWGLLRGIRASCVTSGYIQAQEYVLHGDYNGKVYRQEVGNNFDGLNIIANYASPYLDFGDVNVRKTLHKLSVFVRPEGENLLNAAIEYDWNSLDANNPAPYVLELVSTGDRYGTAIYGISRYASKPVPFSIKNIEGGGFSARVTFTSSDQKDAYSIQGFVYEFEMNGRK